MRASLRRTRRERKRHGKRRVSFFPSEARQLRQLRRRRLPATPNGRLITHEAPAMRPARPARTFPGTHGRSGNGHPRRSVRVRFRGGTQRRRRTARRTPARRGPRTPRTEDATTTRRASGTRQGAGRRSGTPRQERPSNGPPSGHPGRRPRPRPTPATPPQSAQIQEAMRSAGRDPTRPGTARTADAGRRTTLPAHRATSRPLTFWRVIVRGMRRRAPLEQVRLPFELAVRARQPPKSGRVIHRERVPLDREGCRQFL